MIPQRNLSLLSNRLAREGGRRIPEAVLKRDYCLALFLVGLSRAPLRDLLVFKGNGLRAVLDVLPAEVFLAGTMAPVQVHQAFDFQA